VAVALSTATAAKQPSSDARAIVTAFQTSHVLADFDYLPQEITWADDEAVVSLRRKKHEEDECEKESHGKRCEEEGEGRHGRHGRKEEKEHGRYGKHGEQDEEESHGHGKHDEKTRGKYGKKEDKKSHKYAKREGKRSHGKYGNEYDDGEYGGCGKKHHVRRDDGNDDDVGDCGGREENATLKFAATLQQDTESFIADVRDWVDSLMGNVSGSSLVVDTTFTLSLSGDVDMRHPCGGLVANKMFPILEPYVNDPANADFNKTESSKILWRPSRACLKQRNAVEVDGGAHAEFEVRCGDAQLLNATVATGGVSRKIFWHNLQFSGALVSVDVLNGTIKAVGASGLIGELIKYWDVPDNADEILANLTDTAHECAANNTLVVRGLVGGGWRQVFAHSGSSWDDENDGEDGEDKEEVAVVGYAEAFELSYKADAEPPADAPASEAPPSDSPADSKAPATKPSTEAPTDNPKVTTTAPPVEKPADAPTEPRTTQPTPPSNAPSDAPKVTTTAPPVEKATDAPTEPPTTQTTSPTNAPTDAPAKVPTEGPTKTPTEPPTKAPTEAPTVEPTKTPANDASTKEPTNAPTPKTTTPAPTEAPAEGPTAPASSVGDLTSSTLKDLSESASALYVQSGIQCHHHDVSKACFMNTAMSKIIRGKLSTVHLAMSHKQEEDLTPASFFSAPVFVVVALVGAALGMSYRTFSRRAGYRAIPTQA